MLLSYHFLSLLFFIFPALLPTKFVSKNIYLSAFNKVPWKYLSKFGMDYGTGDFDFKIRFSKSIFDPNYSIGSVTVQIHAMMDENWDEIQTKEQCNDKESFSKLTLDVEVPTTGEWSTTVTGHLTQITRPRVWFMVLSDCEGRILDLSEKCKDKFWGNKLQIELNFLNTNRSHLSYEEQGLMGPYLIILCVYILIIVLNFNIFYKYYKREEQIDYPLLLINIVLVVDFWALIFEILHLWIYESNGKGFFLFNLLNQIFDISAQFMIIVIFVLVGWGWTINFMNLESFEFFLPLLSFVGIIHLLIVGLSRLTDDEFTKNHDYEGFAGYLIIFLRVGLYIYFMMGIYDTFKQARFKIKSFIIKFGFLGTVYFLTFPILLTITSYCAAAYVKHKIVMIGTMLLESLVLIILTRIFTNKGGEYYELSFKGKTLLPNNKFE